MTWLNPWAWLGLAAVAVPILIHLLARQASRPLPFPTLRFLRATPLVDLRRRRLSDLLLLAVRIAIIALAAGALAQPFGATTRTANQNRLVIIDASASVDVEAARAAARGYADGAAAFAAIERSDLADAAREAAAWISARVGASTVVVMSDFQRGALDSATLRVLPSTAGVVLHRVPRREVAAKPAGIARLTFDGARTGAEWGPAGAAGDAIQVDSAFDAATNAAIADAARATAGAFLGEARPVTFVLENSPRRETWLQRSRPAHAPWMYDVMAAITPGRAQTVRASDGRAVVFLATSDAATAADAIRETAPALSAGPPVAELEPETLNDADRQSMERHAAPAAPIEAPQSWMGRWFWLAALLLLGVEAMMRRSRRTVEQELAHAA